MEQRQRKNDEKIMQMQTMQMQQMQQQVCCFEIHISNDLIQFSDVLFDINVITSFTAPPPTSNANNDTPSIGMPQQNLAPPPPNSMFGDTIVASNPFDDTPIQHSHQNGSK